MSDNRARLKGWLESGAATLHPLTYPQRELWEAAPLDVKEPANSICCTMRIKGPLSEDTARQALARVVERHEVLRLSILPGKTGPLQLVRKTCELASEFADLGTRDIDAVSDAFFAQSFNLVMGPLYRVLVLRRGGDDFVILFAMHHAIGDGWSWGIFAQDLLAAYVQIMVGLDQPLPALPQSYVAWGAADKAYWTDSLLEVRRSFWRPRLANLPRLWDVPISGQHFERRVYRVSAELASRLRVLAAKHGATLYSTLLAAFQVAFGGWAGTRDIVVGSPVANRRDRLSSEIIGSFASMLPLRCDLDPACSFADHLHHTSQIARDCFANAAPFTELVEIAGAPVEAGFNPLYEVRFALQNHPIPRLSVPGLDASLSLNWSGSPRFQLACEISEQGEALDVIWTVNSRLFSQADVERLDALFRRTLDLACQSPETRLADFDVARRAPTQ